MAEMCAISTDLNISYKWIRKQICLQDKKLSILLEHLYFILKLIAQLITYKNKKKLYTSTYHQHLFNTGANVI